MSDEPRDNPMDEPVEPLDPADETDVEDEQTPATAATSAGGTAAAPSRKVRKQRTSPRQFLREVRSELRKVAWPARKELFSYSLVVLVSVTIITLYITALDQVFGTLIVRIFSS